MPRFRVYGTVSLEISMVIEADDADDADDARTEASEHWPGLTGYVGNGGGGDRMIGPSDYDHDEKIGDLGGGDDPEWNHVEQVDAP